MKVKPKRKTVKELFVFILLFILFPPSLPLFTILNVNLLTFLHWFTAVWKPLMSAGLLAKKVIGIFIHLWLLIKT